MAPATTANPAGPNCSFCGHAVAHSHPCPGEITVWADKTTTGGKSRSTIQAPCPCARHNHQTKGTP